MLNLTLSEVLNAFFNMTVFSILFIFLTCFFISYVTAMLFFSSDEETSMKWKSIILNILVFGYIISVFISKNNTSDMASSMTDNLYNLETFLNNKTTMFSVLSFILGLYFIIYFTGIPMTNESKPSSVSFLDKGSWFIFIIALICYIFNTFFDISIATRIIDAILNRLTFDMSTNTTQGDEVFNISQNLYSYHEAQEVCSVFGAQLATYDQVEEAYNNGGEWCNYGWSDGQMALFPTQKSTWNDLQGSEVTKNQCGRPGINGGYMENPLLMLGVNCYGKKPEASEYETEMMKANETIEIPTEEDIEDTGVRDKKNMWKENAEKFLTVNPFNRTTWNN